MRMYLAPVTGTGLPVIADLDPADYYWLDGIVDGTQVTTSLTVDPIRPDCDAAPPFTCTLIIRPRPSAIDRFLVYDSGDMANGVPAGTENVVGGNAQAIAHPEAVVRMNTPLIVARKNTLEDFLGQPRDTFQTDGTNWTPRRLMRWMVGPGWRQRVGGVALESGLGPPSGGRGGA